ncbi:MAG: SPOR domain-containing protein [Magnetococcales bacterium]|nr:SPOR domain-containing protein [Magnetococcales bacterium]
MGDLLHAAEEPAGKTGATADVATHHFTLLTEPSNAKVEIINLKTPYQPNMLLKAGRYHIVVSAAGHETEKGFIDITHQDWIGKVVLHPLNDPVPADEKEANSESQLQEQWSKLEQEKNQLAALRRTLAQEQERLELAKKELHSGRQALELAKQSVELARKEWSEKQLACTPAVEAKPVVETPSKPESAGERQGAAEVEVLQSPVSEAVAARKPLPEVAAAQPAAAAERKEPPPPVPLPAPLANPNRAKPVVVPEEAPKQEEGPASAGAGNGATVAETSVLSAGTLSADTPPKESAAAATPQVAALLAEGMRYLQQARPPRSSPPPESKEALDKLRRAQQLDPDNKAVQKALLLYEKRYVIYTGLFEIKAKADAMVQRIEALGIPAFQQSVLVKGKESLRICIGLFASQEEAADYLQRLKQGNLEITETILRIYKQ